MSGFVLIHHLDAVGPSCYRIVAGCADDCGNVGLMNDAPHSVPCGISIG